jgi:hypothetical protein
MLNEAFHNLEFTTENVWRDFVHQYKAAATQHQLGIQKKMSSVNVEHENQTS